MISTLFLSADMYDIEYVDNKVIISCWKNYELSEENLNMNNTRLFIF